MSHVWDPQRYLTYADERGRPFVDLITRIDAAEPRTVVDLGCGPGNLTALLAARWPDADILGIDSSEAMIRTAAEGPAGHQITFEVADLRDWLDGVEPGSVDVLVSNATLQWIPGHLDLMGALVNAVAPGGWLAFQVPGNAGSPTTTIREELAAEAPYDAHTGDAATVAAHDAATYFRSLRDLGLEVDAWETTYLHLLHGPDPVFTWISATGARPTLQALPEDLRPAFEEELKTRLRAVYPEDPRGVVMPFRRVFVVARKP